MAEEANTQIVPASIMIPDGGDRQCSSEKVQAIDSQQSKSLFDNDINVLENGFHRSIPSVDQNTSAKKCIASHDPAQQSPHSDAHMSRPIMSNSIDESDLGKPNDNLSGEPLLQNHTNHEKDETPPDESSPQTLSSSLGSDPDLNCLEKVNENSHNSKLSMIQDVIEKVSDLTELEVHENDSNGDSGLCSGASCQCSDKDKESNSDIKTSLEQATLDSTSSEVDLLLNKLEKTTLVHNVHSCHCDGDVINGISYIVYESEKQMPDIMRLITKDLSEPYSIYTYRYFIHNWPKLCFLAMADNKCVGAIVCKLDLHKKMVLRGYIAMLAVDSQYRRRQIGSTLVTKAIQAMIRDDCDEVVLETEITNRAALHLYENLGFVRDKRLFRYYLNGVDALRLKLWLR